MTLLKIILSMNILLMLSIMITIMFITIMERKFLGILNNRKAPNFMIFNSLIQSLKDFMKLMTKKILKMNFVMKSYWSTMIFFGIMIMMMIMMNYPFYNSYMFMYNNFYFMFFLYSIMSYFFLIICYSSNSIFSIMAMFRVMVQIISYEVGLMFMFIIPLIFNNIMNFYNFNEWKNSNISLSLMMLMSLMMISLSEMNRIPFDFLESETELVSGFNTEYMASLFSFIFLIEYGFMLFMIMILNMIFMMNMILMLLLTVMIIWTRSFMPRYRYDKMMYMFWKDLVMMVMSFFLLINIL